MARTKNATYEGYRGSKHFSVWHPRYGAARVAAPDEDSALVAAAKLWGVNWTKLEFYTGCSVSKA